MVLQNGVNFRTFDSYIGEVCANDNGKNTNERTTSAMPTETATSPTVLPSPVTSGSTVKVFRADTLRSSGAIKFSSVEKSSIWLTN